MNLLPENYSYIFSSLPAIYSTRFSNFVIIIFCNCPSEFRFTLFVDHIFITIILSCMVFHNTGAYQINELFIVVLCICLLS